MLSIQDKRVLVVGLGLSGRAACVLLRERGAHVLALGLAREGEAEPGLARLRQLGVAFLPAGSSDIPVSLDLVVVDPEIPLPEVLRGTFRQRGIRVISELELGARASLCRPIVVTGTNGKSATAELIRRILTHSHRRTLWAGDNGTPVTSVAGQTSDLDYLTLEAGAPQLEGIESFCPAVAVVMNLTPAHPERYATVAAYVRAVARVFTNQQGFDWAIIQSEALAHMRELNIMIPSKTITFSASSRRADLVSERGMLISRLEDWSGPLLDLGSCSLQGPHQAENLMAALAVGRVLRIPIEEMVTAVRGAGVLPHCCEWVGEARGVGYVDDARCTNPDALQKAVLTMPSHQPGEPNIWLIAGGRDSGGDFHALGPLLSQRVKGTILLGETREKLRAAWGLFTPCTLVGTLLEAVTQAAGVAVPGDIVLLSPACSSSDMFHNDSHRGEVYRQAVERWLPTAVETTTPNTAEKPPA